MASCPLLGLKFCHMVPILSFIVPKPLHNTSITLPKPMPMVDTYTWQSSAARLRCRCDPTFGWKHLWPALKTHIQEDFTSTMTVSQESQVILQSSQPELIVPLKKSKILLSPILNPKQNINSPCKNIWCILRFHEPGSHHAVLLLTLSSTFPQLLTKLWALPSLSFKCLYTVYPQPTT